MNAALKFSVAAVALFAAYAPALAASIAPGSKIDIMGVDTTIPVGVTVDVATGLTFQSVLIGDLAGNMTGSFAGLFTPGQTGSITGSTLNLVVAPASISPFYSFTNGSNTLTFNLGAITNIVRTAATGLAPAGLDVQGTGTISLTGYDSALAGFTLTTQGSGVTTFSATTIAGAGGGSGAAPGGIEVPEPLSLALLGSGLTIVGLLRRKVA